MSLNTQLGVGDEVTFNTPVVVDRFFEFTSENIVSDIGRTLSQGMRANEFGLRADRFTPHVTGAAGSFSIPILSAGWGFWLKHILGAVGTTGPTDSSYTHQGTIASLASHGFTMQVNRPFQDASNQAVTWSGGKISSATFKGGVEEDMMCEISATFASETTATGLAVASYPTVEPMSWGRASVEVNSVVVCHSAFSFTVTNNLDERRLAVCNSFDRREPIGAEARQITFNLTNIDWEDLTHWNRARAADRSGAISDVVLSIEGPTLIGASTRPEFRINLPAARFDDNPVNVGGRAVPTQGLSGEGLVDLATGEMIEVDYISTDVTP